MHVTFFEIQKAIKYILIDEELSSSQVNIKKSLIFSLICISALNVNTYSLPDMITVHKQKIQIKTSQNYEHLLWLWIMLLLLFRVYQIDIFLCTFSCIMFDPILVKPCCNQNQKRPSAYWVLAHDLGLNTSISHSRESVSVLQSMIKRVKSSNNRNEMYIRLELQYFIKVHNTSKELEVCKSHIPLE